jgi:hypothetical protein
VTVRARDNSANEEAVERAYNFTFDKPQVTDIMPHELGVETAPFAVTVNASSVVGLASITLYRAPHSLSGGYAVANAIEVGSSATSPATFTVDPGALPDGEHILYAVVRDTAGNATLPPQTIFPIGGANGLTVDLTYRCIATTDRYTMPVRVLITGGASPFAPAKVREHLAEANMLAANADSGARLVSIIAFGLKADGTIALDDSNSYVKRIQYSYYNASSTHAVTVSWFTPAFMMNNPVVDPDAGNVSATDPIPDPALLADSDAIATAFDASPLCPALIGDEDDYVLYNVVDGAARANVYTRTNQYWVGTGTSPVTELTACQ